MCIAKDLHELPQNPDLGELEVRPIPDPPEPRAVGDPFPDGPEDGDLSAYMQIPDDEEKPKTAGSSKMAFSSEFPDEYRIKTGVGAGRKKK